MLIGKKNPPRHERRNTAEEGSGTGPVLGRDRHRSPPGDPSRARTGSPGGDFVRTKPDQETARRSAGLRPVRGSGKAEKLTPCTFSSRVYSC